MNKQPVSSADVDRILENLRKIEPSVQRQDTVEIDRILLKLEQQRREKEAAELVKKASETPAPEKEKPTHAPVPDLQPTIPTEELIREVVTGQFPPAEPEQEPEEPTRTAEPAGEKEPEHPWLKKACGLLDGPLENDDKPPYAAPETEDGEDEAEEESRDDLEDFDDPRDAEAVQERLSGMSARFGLRAVLCGLFGLALLGLGLAAGGQITLPYVDPAGEPMLFLGVNLGLLALCVLLSLGTVKSGIVGLFREPSADTMPTLAALAALVQSGALLAMSGSYDPTASTLLSGVAALGLCTNALGKLIQSQVVSRNFQMASTRMTHWAACLVKDRQRVTAVAKGMDEPDPVLVVSRPTGLVRDFLRQSFSCHASEYTSRRLCWVLMAVAAVCTGYTALYLKAGAMASITVCTAVLCLGAPFASTLLAAVPALLMQKHAARMGAVVPGWSSIEELGKANMVLVEARDLFPSGSVQLRGIKTFEKERIDLAILYAASVVVAGGDIMRDVFLQIIEQRTDILYPVERFTREDGRGYSATVNGDLVLVGSREMMLAHEVKTPDAEWEAHYTQNGRRQLLYLAVNGKLFGVFGVTHQPDEEVQQVIHTLHQRGISLLVKAEDCLITSRMIAEVYELPEGCVKVLDTAERKAIGAELNFRPESEGLMTHQGPFASFIGGLRAAEGAAAGEKLAMAVQKAAVLLSCVLAVLMTVTGGLGTLVLPAVVLYQCAWTVLQLVMPMSRQY